MKACQALAQLGHQVRLLVPELEGRKRPPHPSAGQLSTYYGLQTPFPVEWVPAKRALKKYDFCMSTVRLARTYGAEVIYAWPLQAAFFAALFRIPVVLEVHGPPEGKLGPLLFSLLLRLPEKKRILPITIALAKMLGETRRDWHAALNIPRDKEHEAINITSSLSLSISPNGVDLERYADLPEPSEARSQLGLAPVFTAGYTGHLYAGRGMDLLLELARRFPQVNFLWVGGTEKDVSRWKSHLQAERVNNVFLTGFVDNSRLHLYQAAAELLLMPYERTIAGSSGGNSASYASPMKMFEYMACKRTIFSSDLPVIREVLDHRNAILLPPGDIQAWFIALQDYLDQPAKYQTLADQAWLDVQKYTWLERAKRALQGFQRED